MTTSVSVSRFVPSGQITSTSQPWPVRVWHSCQTRRSNGTERFSTTIRALPGKADISLLLATRRRVREPDEVDHGHRGAVAERGADVVVRLPDDEHLRVVGDLGDGVDEEVAQVWQGGLDERGGGPEQRRLDDGGVVDAQVVALAEHPLAELHQRALAQVVGAALEREAEHADPS